MSRIYIKMSYCLEQEYILMAKINLRQYVIFSKPRNFDTADIKRFTVLFLFY